MNLNRDYLYTNEYLDLDGNPIERTPEKYPYSYEPYVQWKGDYDAEKSSSWFSDRLRRWDSKKFDECCEKVWGKKTAYFRNGHPKYVEKFLSLYFEKKVKLTAILEGCNYGNGYPYWLLYCEFESEKQA